MTDNHYNGPNRRSEVELHARLAILHEDVGEIKDALKDLTSAITRLALVEDRMATASAAQERAFKAIAEVEKKVVEIEKILASQVKTTSWVERGIWAAAAAACVYVAKKVGLL